MKNEKLRILYGDDNEQVKDSLASKLRTKNLEVDLASTYEETIAKARANNYDVIITDLEYTSGGREGYDVLKSIIDIPAIKILYTGNMETELAVEAFMHGAEYAILRKDESKLLSLLDKELKGGQER